MCSEINFGREEGDLINRLVARRALFLDAVNSLFSDPFKIGRLMLYWGKVNINLLATTYLLQSLLPLIKMNKTPENIGCFSTVV